jgi:hypothetical protein
MRRLVLVLVVVLALPLLAPRAGASSPATVSAGSLVGTVPSDFFGTRQFVSNPFNSSVMSFLNATPFRVVRFGAYCDDANYTAGLQYNASGHASPLAINWTGVRVFFATERVQWIFCVGGEDNNAASAANQVAYVENTLGLHPTYWSIGNEPGAWNFFNVPLASRSPSDHISPTPAQYATLVRNYTAALRGVDPSIKIVGIQSGAAATQDPAWLLQLAKVDGPNLTAVAVHLYADGKGTAPQTLAQFLAVANLTLFGNSLRWDVQNVSAGCPSCSLPVWLDEFNAYSNSTYQANGYPTEYAMVPYTAASVVEALTAGDQQFLYFSFDDGAGWNYSMINANNGVPRPAYYLFTDILSHLALGSVYTAPLQGAVGSIYAAETASGNARSLLIVNANTSSPVTIGTESLIPSGTWSSSYSWAPNESAPAATDGAATGSVTLPSEGVLLLDWSSSSPPGAGNAEAGLLAAPIGASELAAGAPFVIVIAAVLLLGWAGSRGRR